MGYMDADALIAFVENRSPQPVDGEKRTANQSLWILFLLALGGGFLLNLTPCVLPLVPVNLILIGKGWRRGAAYGVGMAATYGALGLAAAFGGVAFGAVQSSPWFNGLAALVFVFLALAMLDVVVVNGLSSLRKPGMRKVEGERSLLSAFLLGGGAALLAGACVAPVAIAACAEAAVRCAAGEWQAAGLPFALGAGMAAPYPFLAGGIKVLPKPGKWMCWTKRGFAVVLLGFAAHYGWLACNSLAARPSSQANAAPKTSKPLFVKVGAPWCKNCEAMERTTLKEERVVKALSGFEVVKVEINDFGELRDNPLLGGVADRIKGLPAYVIFPAKE